MEEYELFCAGKEPLVIARGGLSGVFPESSPFANQMATSAGVFNTALYCNLQLTKDGIGICLTDLRLQNSTTIEDVFPKAFKYYKVNGKTVRGWFSVDYMSEDLFSKVFSKFILLYFISQHHNIITSLHFYIIWCFCCCCCSISDSKCLVST